MASIIADRFASTCIQIGHWRGVALVVFRSVNPSAFVAYIVESYLHVYEELWMCHSGHLEDQDRKMQ